MYFRMQVFFFVILFVACSSSKKTVNQTRVNVNRSDSLAGLEVFQKKDCVTCHHIEKKLIGPSFLDIARKYNLNEENIEKLSLKIIKGGNGSWSDIPMVPHPSLPVENARSIVKYIFSLKK